MFLTCEPGSKLFNGEIQRTSRNVNATKGGGGGRSNGRFLITVSQRGEKLKNKYQSRTQHTFVCQFIENREEDVMFLFISFLYYSFVFFS